MTNVLFVISVLVAIASALVESESKGSSDDLGVVVDHCTKTKYCGRGYLCCGDNHCCPDSLYCCWPPRCEPSCCKYPFFWPASNLGCPWGSKARKP